jgi:transcriptional regulator with AAA-type ATPase domain
MKEYLSSHYLYKYNIKSLENAMKLVCLMLNDGNKEIKDMVVSKHFG